jgi:hypothetical protein
MTAILKENRLREEGEEGSYRLMGGGGGWSNLKRQQKTWSSFNFLGTYQFSMSLSRYNRHGFKYEVIRNDKNDCSHFVE